MIDAETVHRSCSFPELIDALEQFHQETSYDLKDMLLSSPRSDGQPEDKLLIRAAWAHGSALGIKAAAVFPRNPAESEIPAIHAQFVLFEGARGTPAAVIDGTALTYYKTAADSALGARYLAKMDAASMAMIGAGAMAPYLIQAHCSARPSIQSVVIWNRTASKAETLANSLSIPNVEISAVASIETAVRESDIVSSATMTKNPIISGSWLRPGTHLDLVGAFTLEMRETDDVAIRKSKVFVDSRATTIGEIGEIAIPIRSGTMTEDDVIGDLFDLCSGGVQGRRNQNDITLFKNGGGGHLDLMTARHIVSIVESVRLA